MLRTGSRGRRPSSAEIFRFVGSDFVGTIALAGIFGIMAAMLLTSSSGPEVSSGFTALQVLGSLLLFASGTVALKVIYDVFRRRDRP